MEKSTQIRSRKPSKDNIDYKGYYLYSETSEPIAKKIRQYFKKEWICQTTQKKHQTISQNK